MGETAKLQAGEKPFEVPEPLLFVLLSSEPLYVLRILQDPVMPITVRTTALPLPNTEPGGPVAVIIIVFVIVIVIITVAAIACLSQQKTSHLQPSATLDLYPPSLVLLCCLGCHLSTLNCPRVSKTRYPFASQARAKSLAIVFMLRWIHGVELS